MGHLKIIRCMWLCVVLFLYSELGAVKAQPGLCHQRPRDPKSPAKNGSESPYRLFFETKSKSKLKYTQGQTYVVVLDSNMQNQNHTFKEFMITVEDPEVDNNPYQFKHQNVDVGALKTLDNDGITQFSAKCYGTVENTDLSDKRRVELHWVSPKTSVEGQRIRFRAMVAENNEVWYTGGGLTIVVEKDDSAAADTTPIEVNRNCRVCSEARYEVVFNGVWSQGTHSYNYPRHPDSNLFSTMIGASHHYGFTLWAPNKQASPELTALANNADTDPMEKYIIENMFVDNGTRTLIKGKMHKHPHMSEPSHAIFRVDPVHHLFSLVVAMKPSPDWFLGTFMFELCDDNNRQWLERHRMPLFPWDAGTMDGISYESPASRTSPVDSVDRVALGSFSRESPFYQLNLNDLTPYAYLDVQKLDEYTLDNCEQEEGDSVSEPAGERTWG